MSKPCVFLDRDGIVNKPPPQHVRYVLRRDDFVLMPEFLGLLRVILKKGYSVVIVTNQRGVGLGKMSEQNLRDIHDHLLDRLKQEKLEVLDILFCPSAHDDHPDRKPNPGMILKAAQKHDLDLSRSWMIGDSPRDVEAGHRAGCKTILVSATATHAAADYRVPELEELTRFLEEHL